MISYGELGVDNIVRVPWLPTPERAAFPIEESYGIGGAAANTAVWLAGWDVRVALTGNVIGDDELGQRLQGWLGAYPSLSTRWLEVRPGIGTPFCRILSEPNGERSVLVYWYPRTPRTALGAEVLRSARYLTLDLYGGDDRLTAARAAHAAGVPVVVSDLVDPAHHVLPLASMVVVSAAYLRSERPGVDVLEHAATLRAVAGATVVLTDGADPIRVVGGDRGFQVRPPAVTPVEATGAGDAFRAGLLRALVRGAPLEAAVAWGAAAGSLCVLRVGGASDVASVAEVDALAAGLRVEPIA